MHFFNYLPRSHFMLPLWQANQQKLTQTHTMQHSHTRATQGQQMYILNVCTDLNSKGSVDRVWQSIIHTTPVLSGVSVCAFARTDLRSWEHSSDFDLEHLSLVTNGAWANCLSFRVPSPSKMTGDYNGVLWWHLMLLVQGTKYFTANSTSSVLS